MKKALDTLVEQYGAQDLAALYDALETAMVSTKNIKPNLDYPSGPAYHLIGFDTEIFTPLFVASRVTGWTAHVIEQLEANALIRPLSEYIGPDEPAHRAGDLIPSGMSRIWRSPPRCPSSRTPRARSPPN